MRCGVQCHHKDKSGLRFHFLGCSPLQPTGFELCRQANTVLCIRYAVPFPILLICIVIASLGILTNGQLFTALQPFITRRTRSQQTPLTRYGLLSLSLYMQKRHVLCLYTAVNAQLINQRAQLSWSGLWKNQGAKGHLNGKNTGDNTAEKEQM